MPIETTLLFELSDIKSIRFVCWCGSVQAFPASDWDQLLLRCANNPNHNWFKDESPESKAVSQLRQALKVLAKPTPPSDADKSETKGQKRPLKIQIEFDGAETLMKR